jgi:glycosyltransferase involved in cell wall biosynthesis
MWPKVSIIWLNYNPSKSLESVAELDYLPDKHEFVVVDNGSTDGSYEKIKDLLEKKSSCSSLRTELRDFAQVET